jgi:hypothetical protein
LFVDFFLFLITPRLDPVNAAASVLSMMEIGSALGGNIGHGAGWIMTEHALAWFVTGSLLFVGIIGCLIPILPGHVILLLAAVAHRLILGEASGLRWWSFLILVILLVLSQVFEFLSGAAGAKWFGGSKWGAWGALIGGVVGMFFFPFGLILGPLIGAMAFELIFSKKETKPAVVSGVGSVLGTVAGMLIKLAIGIVMVIWIIVDALEVV